MRHLNYKHLHYFWVVAKHGRIARASEVLHLTPQTISGQLRELEDTVGEKLFARAGRQLVLTDVGRMVYEYADEMFALGTELVNMLGRRVHGGRFKLTIGVADVVPRLIAYRLMEPALALGEQIRFVCREGHFDELLSDLTAHKLDIVLADGPVNPALNGHVRSHLLGESDVSFFATAEIAKNYRDDFPRSLNGAPLLVPTADTSLRRALDQWFEQEGIQPTLAGEFEDSALMKVFGQSGMGIFASPSVIDEEVICQHKVELVGRTDRVQEHYYAIAGERKLKHPAVLAISNAARKILFDGEANAA